MANEKKRKLSTLALFLIPIGIAVNFVGGEIALLLKIPLYLDSIGTIVVGALCGYLPGILVGLLSNVLVSITDPATLFFAPLNIGFGILAAFLSKRGWFKHFGKTLVSTLMFAFIGGAIGACITWLVYGFDFGTGNPSIIAVPLYALTGMNKFVCELIAEYGMDVVDKGLSLIVSFAIFKALPTNFLIKLPLGRNYIKAEDLALDEEK